MQAEELHRQVDEEKLNGGERVSNLNKQIRELYEKSERLDEFDKVMKDKVNDMLGSSRVLACAQQKHVAGRYRSTTHGD